MIGSALVRFWRSEMKWKKWKKNEEKKRKASLGDGANIELDRSFLLKLNKIKSNQKLNQIHFFFLFEISSSPDLRFQTGGSENNSWYSSCQSISLLIGYLRHPFKEIDHSGNYRNNFHRDPLERTLKDIETDQ